ncbi:hypothetical protein FQR65_LT09997 [Abscondita terminalis]|nr:hypothetical protein FQR65_LT09997 [Abscondita terminalis]
MSVRSRFSESFLKDILGKFNEDNKNIEYAVSPMCVGENFASDLWKISVKYKSFCETDEEKFFVLKCFSENDVSSEYAKLTNIFDTEIDIYSRVLPKIYSLEYVKKFTAPTLYASLTPQPIIIMEDLTKQGYQMQCRHKGLDLNHSLLVIEKLAYLHASSIAISKKESLSNFDRGLFWPSAYTTKWFIIGFEMLIKTCEKLNNLNRYAEKLDSIKNDFFVNSTKAFGKTTLCKVLNHGDCWVNNFMFLYNDDGTLKDVTFIDFQQSLYASQVFDLHFFWATSPNLDVLVNHWKTILDCYCNEFFKIAKKLNIADDIPSKAEIESEFRQKAFYGLMAY